MAGVEPALELVDELLAIALDRVTGMVGESAVTEPEHDAASAGSHGRGQVLDLGPAGLRAAGPRTKRTR